MMEIVGDQPANLLGLHKVVLVVPEGRKRALHFLSRDTFVFTKTELR